MFNKNHLNSLLEKKQNLNQQIHEEEKRPCPDEVELHALKSQRLQVKEEILEYQNKH